MLHLNTRIPIRSPLLEGVARHTHHVWVRSGGWIQSNGKTSHGVRVQLHDEISSPDFMVWGVNAIVFVRLSQLVKCWPSPSLLVLLDTRMEVMFHFGAEAFSSGIAEWLTGVCWVSRLNYHTNDQCQNEMSDELHIMYSGSWFTCCVALAQTRGDL